MLNDISWQEYWTTLAFLTAGYYLVIYALFYRKDFKVEFPNRIKERMQSTASPAVSTLLEEQNVPVSINDGNGDEQLVYACMDELSAYFGQSKKTKCAKEELVYAMQTILSKYPSLKSSEFKGPVSNLIVSEAAHNCSIHLNEADVIHVWLEK